MDKLILWIKSKLGISNLEQQVKILKSQVLNLTSIKNSLLNTIDELQKELRKYQTVDIDVSYRGMSSTIIVTGRLNGRDFVNVYDINHKDFSGLVNHIKDYAKYYEIRNVDGPIGFTSTLKRDLKRSI